MYSMHDYPDTHIWNCDVPGAQVEWSSSGHTLAGRGHEACILSCPMRENDCLSCLASMHSVLAFPSFTYLRVGHLGTISLLGARRGVVWPCKKTWMARALFNKWIIHFLLHIGKMYGISNNKLALTCNGWAQFPCHPRCYAHCPDIFFRFLTIPSYTFHTTQSLDMSIFKLFKTLLRKYWNF